MRDTVARVLFDQNGNAIKVTQDGSDYKYEFLGKLRNAAGTIVNPATQDTLSDVDTKLGTIDSVLDSIKDTDGVKKITDQLPAGTNEIGKVAQGTKAALADAWPQVLVDSSGNAIGVYLDESVYRIRSDSKTALKETAGTLEYLKVIDDTGSLKTSLFTQGGDPISFPAIASDPDGIVNDFARQTGGADTADLRVDGSVTPVDFTFEALGGGEADLAINSIGFVMVANGIVSGSAKFAGLTKLTNGVEVIYSDGVSETVIGNLRENEDFMHFASAGGYDFWALNKDQVQSQFFISGAVVLPAGSDDKIIIRISDDIDAGIDYFKCYVKSVKRGG